MCVAPPFRNTNTYHNTFHKSSKIEYKKCTLRILLRRVLLLGYYLVFFFSLSAVKCCADNSAATYKQKSEPKMEIGVIASLRTVGILRIWRNRRIVVNILKLSNNFRYIFTVLGESCK